MEAAGMSAGDAFQEVIERAVEAAVKKALNVSEVTNRRLMTIEEGAIYLSLSKREVYNMIACADLPAVTHGRRKMLDIRDLEAWIDQNKGA
jgi:excisionase family DNA binding protein